MANPLTRIKAVAASLAVLGASIVPSVHAQSSLISVRIAFSTWTGYGPLVVGVQDGLFKKQGLNVSYTIIEAPTLRRDALRTGRLDGAASTVDTFDRWAGQGAPVVEVFGIDRSVGGDGIVAKKSITSVKQLKGQTVAVNVGSVSEWFLYYVLQQNGLSVNDVNILDMPDSGVAGSTFHAGKVAVAVTWEPWLTRAAQVPFGHVLVSSKQYPNIIVDDFAFRADFAKAHPDVVAKFIKGYYAAVNLILKDPKSTYPIIGKYTDETPAQVGADLSTVKLMDLATSKAYFGTSSDPGPIYSITQQASAFWLKLHDIRSAPNPNQIIDSQYLGMM
jgi:NitT/TauT family transport system substrate-binding protein